jgi:hypothetical protein
MNPAFIGIIGAAVIGTNGMSVAHIVITTNVAGATATSE